MLQVEVKPITEENWREALTLAVAPDQEDFVAGVRPVAAIALAKAYIKPGGKAVDPYGIYHMDTMVGFFNLHYTPNSREDFWLFHFFIDHRFQRRGLGLAAVGRLIQHLQASHPTCRRLRLTVHPQNQAAQRFYQGLGFSDDGVLTFGEQTYSLVIPDASSVRT